MDEMVQEQARHFANQAAEILVKREIDISADSAMETLAVLDAEWGITTHMDKDDVLDFISEFKKAVTNREDNHEKIEAEAKGDNT